MNYQLNEVSRNIQTIRLAIGLLLMSLAFIYGRISVIYLVIFALGFVSMINKITNKKESILIDEKEIFCLKGNATKMVINLPSVRCIHVKREGNWAVRRDVLIIETNEGTVDKAITNFDMNEIKTIFEETCKIHDISFLCDLSNKKLKG